MHQVIDRRRGTAAGAEGVTPPVPGSGDEWSARRSAELYGVEQWGAGFFEVGANGDAAVRLRDAATGELHSLSMAELVRDLEARGSAAPLLLRFPGILESRIESLHEGFACAIAETGYRGDYRGVFPVKVNQQQQVIEEVSRFGRRFRYGLEAGSKAELIAALAHLEDADALLVCNGYKDREFVDLALRGQMMGLGVILVVDLPRELDMIRECARSLGVEPRIGIRLRLAAQSTGRWADSGGEQSPFGVNPPQLLEIVERLKKAGELGWLKMIHCHQGSQIPNLDTVRDAVREATRVYAGLLRDGASIEYLNLGGGLAVDYDGSGSTSHHSASYSLPGYCLALVETVREVADHAGVPHPTLVTESGRAITAHYSALVMKTLSVDPFERHDESEPELEAPAGLRRLWEIGETGHGDITRSYQEAEAARLDLRSAFLEGTMEWKDYVRADRLFWQALTKIAARLRQLEEVPESLAELEVLLADHYYANFSIFQSLPDSWAIDQLFPVMPIHRLGERPTREAVIHDVTCDCDGRIKRYVVQGRERATVPLHELAPGEDYYVGVFLVGAYQETLSDMHNLFGDTHAISVEVNHGKAKFTHEVDGDTVAEVLRYVEHSPKSLVRGFRNLAENALALGRITPAQRKEGLAAFKNLMGSYTYAEP